MVVVLPIMGKITAYEENEKAKLVNFEQEGKD